MAQWTGIIYVEFMKFNPHLTQWEVNGYNLLHCEGCSIDAISTNLGEHERPDKGNILSIFSALLIQSLKQPFKQWSLNRVI